MIWEGYWIVALVVASGVAGALISGDLAVARHAAKSVSTGVVRLRTGAPDAMMLSLSVFAGIVIGAIWPIAIFIVVVTKYVREHDDNDARP